MDTKKGEKKSGGVYLRHSSELVYVQPLGASKEKSWRLSILNELAPVGPVMTSPASDSATGAPSAPSVVALSSTPDQESPAGIFIPPHLKGPENVEMMSWEILTACGIKYNGRALTECVVDESFMEVIGLKFVFKIVVVICRICNNCLTAAIVAARNIVSSMLTMMNCCSFPYCAIYKAYWRDEKTNHNIVTSWFKRHAKLTEEWEAAQAAIASGFDGEDSYTGAGLGTAGWRL